MGVVVRRVGIRLGALALLLWAAGCTEEDEENMGEGLASLLLFFLLVVLVIIAVVVVLLAVGVSFLGKGVSKMTRRTHEPVGPWWDPAAQVWRAPDGSVFDQAAQRWLPPPPGAPAPRPPQVGGSVDEADRTGGAVLIHQLWRRGGQP